MKMTHRIGTRMRARGDLIDVDEKTARALASAGIAEVVIKPRVPPAQVNGHPVDFNVAATLPPAPVAAPKKRGRPRKAAA